MLQTNNAILAVAENDDDLGYDSVLVGQNTCRVLSEETMGMKKARRCISVHEF